MKNLKFHKLEILLKYGIVTNFLRGLALKIMVNQSIEYNGQNGEMDLSDIQDIIETYSKKKSNWKEVFQKYLDWLAVQNFTISQKFDITDHMYSYTSKLREQIVDFYAHYKILTTKHFDYPGMIDDAKNLSIFIDLINGKYRELYSEDDFRKIKRYYGIDVVIVPKIAKNKLYEKPSTVKEHLHNLKILFRDQIEGKKTKLKFRNPKTQYEWKFNDSVVDELHRFFNKYESRTTMRLSQEQMRQLRRLFVSDNEWYRK